MATTKAQSIGIWVIVVFMVLGTLVSFAIIPLINQNEATDSSRIQALQTEYSKSYEEYEAKKAAQDEELSNEYYTAFKKYENLPAKFDAGAVKELEKEDLTTGKGDSLTKESSFHAYYLGWTPDGQVFDGSLEGDGLRAPISVTPGGVIQGWTDGIDGMKVGGVRLLTIPSDLAYGESGSGDSIPPNTPLKFIVMVIPSPEAISQPGMPQELYEYYQKQGMM